MLFIVFLWWVQKELRKNPTAGENFAQGFQALSDALAFFGKATKEIAL